MDALDDELYEEIKRLCAEGNTFADHAKFSDSVAAFQRALALVPEPKAIWEASTWIFSAIGDSLFLMRRPDEALSAFEQAVRCPGGLGNPFVHLRLGQSLYELGRRREAADELMRAFMGAGFDIFEGEDPKYLSHLRTVAIIDDDRRD